MNSTKDTMYKYSIAGAVFPFILWVLALIPTAMISPISRPTWFTVYTIASFSMIAVSVIAYGVAFLLDD